MLVGVENIRVPVTRLEHYLNMKMKEKLFEIIDLQLFSSLKLDDVYKKGTSWAGPRLKRQKI